MKHAVASLTTGACMLLASTGALLAANPHTALPTPFKGQPGQNGGITCGSTVAPATVPGHSMGAGTAPGSPFNSSGVADSHYAGTQPQNSANGQFAEYDVACFQAP
jgi:hypothetical protein